MKVTPMIFSAPMVRALLTGRKTQTRRVVKIMDQLADCTFTGDLVDYYGNGRLGMRVDGSTLVQPIPDAPGDLIWVREAWQPMRGHGAWDLLIKYAADGQSNLGDRHIEDGAADVGDWVFPKAAKNGFVSPIFMPRWASRSTLEITDVRVQRVQGISREDVIAEGLRPFGVGRNTEEGRQAAQAAFSETWNRLNAKRGFGWGANPWVRALTFKVHQCNVDQLLQGAAA